MKRKYRILPIFIPFSGCQSRCLYCNQTLITGVNADNIIESATSQMKMWMERGTEWDEVAFYGGTFTRLPAEIRRKLYAIAGGVAIRVSTCPDSIPPEFIDEIKKYNIKTVEFGIQSLSDRVLKLNGRTYSAEQAIETVRAVAPYADISLQFMVGMYGETREDIIYTANRIRSLNVGVGKKLARIYPTLVLKDSPLESLYRSGKYDPLSPEETLLRTALLYTALASAGYKIIRMGLPPEAQGESVIAGYWHPSFGDMVKNFALQQARCVDTIPKLQECCNEGDLWFAEKSNIDLAHRLAGAPHLR